MLAQALGGGADSMLGNFMLAFVAAVAFATIVAVVAGLLLAATSAIAHDLYIGVIRNGQAGLDLQVRAGGRRRSASVSSRSCSASSPRGRTSPTWWPLAFAVAASANFSVHPADAFLAALQYRRHRRRHDRGITGRHRTRARLPEHDVPARSEGGGAAPARRCPRQLARIEAELSSGDLPRIEAAKKARTALGRKVVQARGELERYRNNDTSLVGLRAPLFELRNPGLISVPLGFLAVLLGSLFYRSARTRRLGRVLRAPEYRVVPGEGADGR